MARRPPASTRPTRLPMIDALRGFGLALMAVYHGAWNLSWNGLIGADPGSDLPWKLLAWVTAGLFLALVGVSLVLAGARGIAWRGFGRRLLLVAACAALISLATRLVFEHDWVYFGILHHIAVASVIGLAFVRLPALLTASVAMAALAAPVIAGPLLWHAGLAADVLDGLPVVVGLHADAPPSVDFVPLLPWLGMVLLGIAAARAWLLPDGPVRALAARQPGSAPGRLLVLGGRHSLLVYMLHQPLLFAAAWGLAQVAGVSPREVVPEPRARFMLECTTDCMTNGAFVAACETRCSCLATWLEADGLLEDVLGGHLHGERRQRVENHARACVR